MANKSAARKAKREAARKQKRRGSTSTASQGLVLQVIKEDPELQWLVGFVQQLGEKLFEVEHASDLDTKQRIGWIRISHAVARTGKSLAQDAGDYQGFLRLLDRVGEDEGETDLAQIQADLNALEGGAQDGENAEARREEDLHQAGLDDRKAWRDNQRTLVWLVAFSVIFTAALIAFGAATGKWVTFSAGIAAGMAIGLMKAVFSGDTNPFSAPWWAAPPPAGEIEQRER